jgi:hypothetical protein
MDTEKQATNGQDKRSISMSPPFTSTVCADRLQNLSRGRPVAAFALASAQSKRIDLSLPGADPFARIRGAFKPRLPIFPQLF